MTGGSIVTSYDKENTRVLRKGEFESVPDTAALVDRLFGPIVVDRTLTARNRADSSLAPDILRGA